MAVVTRASAILPSVQRSGYTFGQSQHTKKWTWHSLKTQIATLAISLTLFTTVRLPKESARYGAIPYLVVYTFWLLVVGLPTVLLQLSMGQLSRQDAVGVWRAVPFFRGVGHLRLLTSYLCCVYYMMVTSLSTAYILWIAKGTFPLRDCTKLYITPRGYENKMNATECFNSTFLAPFTEHPQYLGIMAILIFILWFFVPTLLYRLQKTLRVTFAILTPIIIFIAIAICSYIGEVDSLDELVTSYVQWEPLKQPFLWQSSLIQVLLSTQIASGYLTSTGGTVYSHADVRWTTIFIVVTNLLSSWLWVFFWESISIGGMSDRSFIGVLVLIYESSVNGQRHKLWPMLSFLVVFLSGVITILALLFPVYDKLQRITGDHWRLFATVLSAVGTALSIIVLIRGLGVTAILDDMVVPIITAFVTAFEVVGFGFIYGWHHIIADIEFLTKSKVPCVWVFGWWIIPVILIAICGWWIRVFLRVSIEEGHNLWPLFGVFAGMLLIMIVTAAVVVAKEEQFNLLTKIAAAFKPSRLWGPEEPTARYMWMSKKYVNEDISSVNIPKTEELFQRPASLYDMTPIEKHTEDRRYNDMKNANDKRQRLNDLSNNLNNKEIIYNNVINKKKKIRPNVCLATGELGTTSSCDCGRHFKLNVPHMKKGELTTSL